MDCRQFGLLRARSLPGATRPTAKFALLIAGLLSLGGLAASAPAEAASKVCGDRNAILERLKQRHHESPTALGLSSDGAVLEILVSPHGGWTILRTYPDQPTCIMAVGEAWQALVAVGQKV
ncbi:MAG TPA: hypothetical protein VFZ01_11650 [Geminicoccaceae bacterium]